uniref:NADH dehydrogenase subunit 6 n=1 Tax=Cystoclonium purpureum f. stellatum TaxID=3024809 RepID=UPI0023EF891C|nr:NADH dehydrogenase subunit 6 [Cystoclonium purpureum f. stellatum]WDY85182.1 NADH dehydrogenase subunit 6 [Cystoclonium purpureum f. stellatum]
MNLDLYLFYILSLLTLISSLMVISLSNAVHSVLFLILVFCNVSGLLILLGAEFLSLMLIIVYVGAIAVLFLFVVMMLNIKMDFLKISNFSIVPLGLLIFCILFNQFSISIYDFDLFQIYQKELDWTCWINESKNLSNIKVIGLVLYTEYSLLFILCGFILLIAMVGAIVLTMHQRKDVKKQKIEIQLSRNPSNVIKFITLRK